MRFVSSMNIVHRDLAARNILMTGDMQSLKISDFGMARETTNGVYIKDQGVPCSADDVDNEHSCFAIIVQEH